MDCSIRNSSLRNLINDEYLYNLWQDYTEFQCDCRKSVIWNKYNEQCFFIEFRRTITLEMVRLMKLRDLILKINKMLYEWEELGKIEIVPSKHHAHLLADKPYKVRWD
jgi:hypothetical protein